MTKDDEKRVLEKQIEDWTLIPELLVEDALRVDRLGWPEGFEVDILNAAGT